MVNVYWEVTFIALLLKIRIPLFDYSVVSAFEDWKGDYVGVINHTCRGSSCVQFVYIEHSLPSKMDIHLYTH